jgi:hypothetical protein
MDRNAIVVARVDIPSLGICKHQSYKWNAIYLQAMKNSIMDKIPLDSLIMIVVDDQNSKRRKIPTGYTQ